MNSIVRYNPRSLGLLDDFDRIFDSFLAASPVRLGSTPAVDIREEEGRYVLEAELPGLGEKDIEVKVNDSLLTISGKTGSEREEKKDGYVLRERGSRSFCRSFVLPKDVDRERIDAGFHNGLLTLALNKAPEAQPKTIEVKAN